MFASEPAIIRADAPNRSPAAPRSRPSGGPSSPSTTRRASRSSPARSPARRRSSSRPAARPRTSRSRGRRRRARRGADRIPRDPRRPGQDAPPEDLRRRARRRLARRPRPGHRSRQSIEAFDLVVVNLYPFEKTVAAGKGRAEVVEMIDVGGPAMIRAAAKNHGRVAVVVDPADYDAVLEEIRTTGRHLASRRASASPRGPSPGPPPTTPRSPATSPRSVREPYAFPGEPRLRLRPRRRPALRREPAPARGALRVPVGAARRARPLRDAPGQGALVQQPARPRLGGHPRPRLRRPRRRHRQAQQPVRRRASARRSRRRSAARSPAIRWRPSAGSSRSAAGSTARSPRSSSSTSSRSSPPTSSPRRPSPSSPRSRTSGCCSVPVSRRPRRRARLEAHRGRPARPGRGHRARPELDAGSSSRSASRRPSSGRRASSPGRSRAASSRTRSCSPTPGRRSASAPAR